MLRTWLGQLDAKWADVARMGFRAPGAAKYSKIDVDADTPPDVALEILADAIERVELADVQICLWGPKGAYLGTWTYRDHDPPTSDALTTARGSAAPVGDDASASVVEAARDLMDAARDRERALDEREAAMRTREGEVLARALDLARELRAAADDLVTRERASAEAIVARERASSDAREAAWVGIVSTFTAGDERRGLLDRSAALTGQAQRLAESLSLHLVQGHQAQAQMAEALAVSRLDHAEAAAEAAAAKATAEAGTDPGVQAMNRAFEAFQALASMDAGMPPELASLARSEQVKTHLADPRLRAALARPDAAERLSQMLQGIAESEEG